MIGPSLLWVLCGQALAFINDNRYISTQRRDLKSRGLVAEVLSHRVTKAKLVIFSPSSSSSSSEDKSLNDRERGFAIIFRTPALDDTGVTHILEHSVFEGSKKYPVMNSIGHFDRSSMATFVNAMTAPESTMYPVATVDKTDLLNLASVYMDGVFDPLILTNRTGFDREGWHYQYDDSSQTLSYGGVVYNEMKGVYSNPKSLISRTVRRVLYENSTLGLESGGHPEKIPTLSYDYAIKYYMLHYHPANAYFFYYGPQSDFRTQYSFKSPAAIAATFSTDDGGGRGGSSSDGGGSGSASPVGKKILDMIDWYTTMAQARFQRKYNNLGQWTQNITSIVLPQLPENTLWRPSETGSTGGSTAGSAAGSTAGSAGGSSGGYRLGSNSVIVREVSQKIPSSNNKTTIRIDSLIDLTENFTPCELQAINVLNTLYFSSKESPLYQRLEREQIGETISGISISTGYPAIQFALQIDGVEPSLLQHSQSETTQSENIQSESTPTPTTTISDRILGLISEEVARVQFSPARVYSVIKRMEISLKAEMSTQSGRAMNLFDEIVDPWLYVGEPLQLLERVENLNCVKELYMNNTSYFEDLLKRRLHPVEPRGRFGRKIVVMKAEGDPSASTRLEELEQAKLDRLKQTFSTEELTQISDYATKLESAVNAGDSSEDLATLPTLSPKNIVREVDPDQYSVTALAPNGITSAEEVRGATIRTLKARPVTEKFTEWMLQSAAGGPTFRSLETANVNLDVINSSLTLSSDMWLKAAQLMMNQQLQQQPPTSSRNMPAHLQLVEAVIPRGRPLTLNEAASGAITRETQQMRRIPNSLESKLTESYMSARTLQNEKRGRAAASTPLFFYHGTTGGLVFITLHFDLNDSSLEELSQIAILDHLLNHGYIADLEPTILRETLDTFTGGGITLDWHIKDAKSTDDEEVKQSAKNVVSDNSVGSVIGTLSFRCLISDLELCMGFVERFTLNSNLSANTQNAQIVANWLKREIINREQSGLKNPNGLASTRVRSKYNIKTRLAEMLEGLDAAESFYKPWLQSLTSSENPASIWQTQIGSGLERLLQKILIQENMAVQLTAERDSLPTIRERLLRFMERLPQNRKLSDSCWSLTEGRVDRPARWRSEITQGSMGYSSEDEADKIDAPKIATDDLMSSGNDTAQESPWTPLNSDLEVIEYDLRVNFNYWLLKLQNPGDETRIPYSVFARVLTNKFLTPRVRMVGGAYGVWSTYSYHDGYIVFGSYRDPHRARTFREYALAAKAFTVDSSDLDGFVIRFIADMDKPISILEQSNRQFNRWAEGLTQAQRQRYRDDVLNANTDQGAVFQQALWEAMQCEDVGEATETSEMSGEDFAVSSAEAGGADQTLICSGGIKVSVGGRNRS